MNKTEEIWMPVKGYDGYEVSNLGRIRSFKINKNGRVLKNRYSKLGYNQVIFSESHKQKSCLVHRVVYTSFIGEIPKGMVIDHINNKKSDNRLQNLQCIPIRENSSKDQKNKTSKYTGVSFHKGTKKWMAQIGLGQKKEYLGVFNCETAAHLTYQKRVSII